MTAGTGGTGGPSGAGGASASNGRGARASRRVGGARIGRGALGARTAVKERPVVSPEAPPPPPRPVIEPPEDALADGSAFYRFSAFLGVLALILLAGALVWFNVLGYASREVVALLVIALVLGVMYAIPRFEEISAGLRTRTARQGGNATLLTAAFIGLLVVGNWYANRHSPEWDLTTARRYTLSDQTKKVLRGLNQDVKVTAFLPARDDDGYIRGTKDLLNRYKQESRRVTVEFIDPEVTPGVARQYNLTATTVAIFESSGRREETTGLTEQDFTSALLKVTRTEKKKIYFLQGHQERDPESSAQAGFSQAAEALKRENYDVAKLSLVGETSAVPADAAVLVIAGPRSQLLEQARTAVDEYLARGGHVFYLADPRMESGLEPVLDKWNVTLGNDLVVDPVRYFRDPFSPVPQPIAGHRVSSSLTDLTLPGARSIAVKPGAGSDFVIAPLLRTDARAWGETNFTPGAPAQLDAGQDTQGPLNLAIAVNKADPAPAFNPAGPIPTPATGSGEPKGRLIVVGNSEFASNAYVQQIPGNRDLFVNSINWLSEEEDLISIRAVPNDAPPIMLTNQSQVLVLYATVVFIPLAVLLVGATIWWQRR